MLKFATLSLMQLLLYYYRNVGSPHFLAGLTASSSQVKLQQLYWAILKDTTVLQKKGLIVTGICLPNRVGWSLWVCWANLHLLQKLWQCPSPYWCHASFSSAPEGSPTFKSGFTRYSGSFWRKGKMPKLVQRTEVCSTTALEATHYLYMYLLTWPTM